MPRPLTITPTPYKSSRLATPPSPFSPRLPITPPPAPPAPRKATPTPPTTHSPPPPPPPPPLEPLNWLWQCHLCSRVYRLGVTRRCLDDGHHFCAGTTTVKRSKRSGRKVVRHKACASEFDYAGWKAWGVWRRGIGDGSEGVSEREGVSEGEVKGGKGKDCWGRCDYPSECRWGKQFGVRTPVTVAVPSSGSEAEAAGKGEAPVIVVAVAEVGEKKKGSTTFEEILLDGASEAGVEASSRDELVKLLTRQQSVGATEQTMKPSVEDLLESAKRRKRRSAGQVPSPLGSNPPSPTTTAAPVLESAGEEEAEGGSSTANYLQKAFDDFELDFRKSMERAGCVLTGWASSIRSTADLEEKAEAFVKGLKGAGKRK